MTQYRSAHAHEVSDVLHLMKAYYAADHLVFDAGRAEKTVREVLEHPEFGQIFLLERDGEKLGYFVLLWNYSLEFGGRVAVLDELYVRPEFQGQGHGRGAISHAEAFARGAGAVALRMEVTFENTRAKDLYIKIGYEDLGRSYLVKTLQT